MNRTVLLVMLCAIVAFLPARILAAENGSRLLDDYGVQDPSGVRTKELVRTRPGFCRAVERRCTEPRKIFIGPNARGFALARLGELFDVALLSADPNLQELGPIVVGPEDLNDAAIARQAERAYATGHTVAVIEAQPEHAAQLRSHVGASGSCTVPGEGVALVGLQRNTQGSDRVRSEYVLRFRESSFEGTPRQRDRRFRQRSPIPEIELRWLHDRFQESPPTSGLQGDTCSDPTSCLTQLATGYNCSVLAALTDPDQSLEIENFTWAAREFSSKPEVDIYYVLNNFLVTASTGDAGNSSFTMDTGSTPGIAGLASGTIALTDPSPGESTQTSTTYTSGISKTIGATVGTASQVSGGVTISNSTSHSVPSTVLTYTADLSTASLDYSSNVTPPGQNDVWITVSTTNQWLWSVPMDAYPANAVTFPFTTTGKLSNFGSSWDTSIDNDIPLPFDTWTLDVPMVARVDPVSVVVGTLFTITGMGFYPGTVNGVTLDGTFLPAANWIANSASEITVIAPSSGFTLGTELPVVVQTQQGDSSETVTVTLEAAGQ